MNLEEMRDDYDWREAFAYSSRPMSDVVEIIAYDNGENDEEDWIGVFRLNDGAFLFLKAGCDYTGWDCQADGDSYVRNDLRTLLLNDVGEDDRARLGYDINGNRTAELDKEAP